MVSKYDAVNEITHHAHEPETLEIASLGCGLMGNSVIGKPLVILGRLSRLGLQIECGVETPVLWTWSNC